MPILPLPQFEADLERARLDAEAYERLSTPKSLVVRFGIMRLVGEYPFEGSAKPGCGSKIVVRTHRGTELGEMLTSTCPNAGCSKSVTRQEMLQYIENSGGQDYPFFSEGKALRVASIEDLNEQARIDALRPAMVRFARERVAFLNLPIKIIDAEPILGGERLTFYFASEDRIDFRDLVHELSHEFKTRIELRQVGARDEARLIADYEKCGQHCCCRQFLKVLKPVSIKSAKTQKATLDPLKISGRCGRLMCCLRYEDQTYDELVKRLPKMKKRVGTPQGVGIVVDRQILTQLVLVRLEHDGAEIALPVEDIMAPEDAPARGAPPPRTDPLRGMPARDVERTVAPGGPRDRQRDFRERRPAPPPTGLGAAKPSDAPAPPQRNDHPRPPREAPPAAARDARPPSADSPNPPQGEPGDRRRRRRRKKKGGGPFGGGPAFG